MRGAPRLLTRARDSNTTRHSVSEPTHDLASRITEARLYGTRYLGRTFNITHASGLRLAARDSRLICSRLALARRPIPASDEFSWFLGRPRARRTLDGPRELRRGVLHGSEGATREANVACGEIWREGAAADATYVGPFAAAHEGFVQLRKGALRRHCLEARLELPQVEPFPGSDGRLKQRRSRDWLANETVARGIRVVPGNKQVARRRRAHPRGP